MAVQGDIIRWPARGTRRVRSSARARASASCHSTMVLVAPGARGVSALWTSAEIEAATGGRALPSFEVSGVTFDSREVQPGDLFVAMPGTGLYGRSQIRRGRVRRRAAGAIVSQAVDVLTCWSRIPQGRSKTSAARRAERSKARIVGVTGSVGKTSTKEALHAALDRISGGKAHRSVKSYNNHTGAPAQPRAHAARSRNPRCSRWA